MERNREKKGKIMIDPMASWSRGSCSSTVFKPLSLLKRTCRGSGSTHWACSCGHALSKGERAGVCSIRVRDKDHPSDGGPIILKPFKLLFKCLLPLIPPTLKKRYAAPDCLKHWITVKVCPTMDGQRGSPLSFLVLILNVKALTRQTLNDSVSAYIVS